MTFFCGHGPVVKGTLLGSNDIRFLVQSPSNLVMGTDQNFLIQVGLGQFFVGQVGSAIFGLGLGLENFP